MAVSDLLLNILSRSDKRGLTEAADELDKLGTKADGAGTKLSGMAKESSHVDEQITKTKAKIRELGEEFDKTGSKELLPQLRRERGSLNALEKIKKDLTSTLIDAGEQGGKGLVDGLSGALSGFASDHKVGVAIAAGIVVAAPLIGAAVNAAVLLGVGAGGIAAGIVGAIQDPQVKSAWSDFGDFAKRGLADAASSFVGPMQSAAVTARGALSQVLTSAKSGLDALAPSFTHLVDGLARMATRIDFASAFRAAAPLVDKLAEELPHMGDALNSFLQSMERGGQGAAQGLHDLVTIIDDAIIAVGYLTEAMSKTWDFLRNNPIGKDLVDLVPFGSLLRLIDDTGSKGKKAGEDVKKGAEDGASGLGGMAYAASQAALSVDALNTAIDKLVTGQLTSKNAHLAFNQSILDMEKAVKQNGTTLDDHTDKGIANSQALLKMAQAAEADRQSVLQQTQDVGKATVVFDDHMNQVYATAKALGLNRDQVDLLIGSIKNVPHDTEANIALKNAGKTKDDIREINRGLTDLNGKTANTYVTTHYTSTGTPVAGVGQAHASFALGGIRHAAVGMIMPPTDPGWVLAGEPQTGGEALIPFRGISPQRAAMLGQTVLGGYGYDVVPRSSGYASPVMARGGGTATVVHEHHVIVQEPSGRRLAELVISDGRNGGAINTYIQQVASR